MTEMIKNRLWALPTNENNLKLRETFSHFYADEDHILIISSEAPEGAMEVTPELEYLLTQSDWLWIWSESGAIQREEELKYREELDGYMKAFGERFFAELEKLSKKGGVDIGNNTDGADGSSGDNEL